MYHTLNNFRSKSWNVNSSIRLSSNVKWIFKELWIFPKPLHGQSNYVGRKRLRLLLEKAYKTTDVDRIKFQIQFCYISEVWKENYLCYLDQSTTFFYFLKVLLEYVNSHLQKEGVWIRSCLQIPSIVVRLIRRVWHSYSSRRVQIDDVRDLRSKIHQNDQEAGKP